MRTPIRLTLLACASLFALAFANAAWSAYEPNLLVASERQTLRSPTSLVIGVTQTPAEDATAFVDITVPEGYSERLVAPPGTVIGDVAATALVRGSGNTDVDVTGQIVTANPADFIGPPNNKCAQAQGPHTAVWLLNVTVLGSPVSVPIFVDDTNAPGVSAHIKFCLAAAADTTAKFELRFVILELRGVFTNPAKRAAYLWSSTLTPYVPNTSTPNQPGTVEARAVVPLPVRVTVKAKRKGRVVTLTGKVDLPGNAIPRIVQIWAGPSPRKLKLVARANVTGTGTFTIRRPRVGKRTRIQYYQARVDTQFADAKDFGHCQLPPPRAPSGCVSATYAALFVRSGIIRSRFPRG